MNRPRTSFATPPNPKSPPVPAQPHSKRLRYILVAACLLLLTAWWIWPRGGGARVPGAAGHLGAGGGAPVPVVAGQVEQKDVPIYLEGLGTVQAFNTVTVHTRVDGQLDKVLFTEGQNVKTGDLVAQIDPRPYQAALDQAIAKKAQDEAQLANAKITLVPQHRFVGQKGNRSVGFRRLQISDRSVPSRRPG